MLDLQDDKWDDIDRPNPWPKRIGIGLLVLIPLNIILWFAQGRMKGDVASARAALEQELTDRRQNVESLRQDLYEQKAMLDNAKHKIDSGLLRDRKIASAQYYKLVEKYDLDTQRFKTIAAEYNAKITEYRAVQDQQQSRWVLIPVPIKLSFN